MTGATALVTFFSIIIVIVVVVIMCFKFAIERGLKPGFLIEFVALGLFKIRLNLKTN